jgi:HAE1 family hydrophobic/amphiphilic exporter-1
MEVSMQKDLPELHLPKNILGKIASLFIDRFRVVFLMIFAVIILGFVTYTQLPKETIPDISLNFIYVQVSYPGASVDDIDSLVSDPVETMLSNMSEVKEVTATINSGYTLIISEFDSDVDMDAAEQKIRNDIAQLNLPDGAMTPVIGIFETGEMPIFNVTVTGDYDLVSLKAYGENIQTEMEKVTGIRKVDLTGGYEREIQIIVDTTVMKQYGLTYSSIASALQGSNINLPAGSAGIDHENVNIRVDERFTSQEDISNLIISSSPNRTIFLHDVAIVKDAYKAPSSLSRLYLYDTEEGSSPETTPAVYLTVYRENGFDIVGAAEALREILDTAPGRSVPTDIKTIITSDQSVDVTKELDTVINNALGGLISVIIVLYIFIGLNEALIVSSVIPISLFITLFLMKFAGITFNTISLTGFIIALGLLVDNAIVVMENIDRLRDEGVDRVTAAKMGLNQVAPAVLAATLTTILAFIPVAIMPGMIGKFLGVMPQTIIYIIGASFFVSMVVTPTLCAKFLTPFKKKRGAPDQKMMLISSLFIFLLSLLAFSNKWHITPITIVIACFFTGFYLLKVKSERKTEETGKHGIIEKYKLFMFNLIVSRGKKTIVFLVTLVVLVGSIMTIPTGILKLELFPAEEPTSLSVNVEAPIGTLLGDTSDIVYKAEAILFDTEGIESFTTTVGGDNDHLASIDVELVDLEERSLTGEEMQQMLRKAFSEIPGATFEVKANSSMSRMSSGSAISLGLIGDDFDQLKEYAQKYYDVLVTIEGVVEPKLSSSGGNREVVIDIDPNRVAYYGLNLGAVASEIRQHITGSTVGTYLQNGDEYDISLYYESDHINSIKDFDKIFFTSMTGQSINFNEVASIVYQEGTGTISKENGQMIVYAEADIAPGFNTADVNKVFSEKVADIKLPKGVSQKVGGEMSDLNEQIGNMIFAFVLALLMVYIVLVVQFNSFLQPLMILFSVPFAIIGVVIGLIVTQNNLGFFAMFGIVALVGIAVNDAIVLIDFTNYLRKESMPLREAVAEAVKTRFQPVIATSLTTIGGVLPLALFNDSFSELGYALIFGLFASTVLTLMIIPIVYYSVEKRTEKWFKPKEDQ